VTADEYRLHLQMLSLTINGAGRFLGVNDRTARRFAEGGTPIPFAVAALLKVMVRYGITVEMVIETTETKGPWKC